MLGRFFFSPDKTSVTNGGIQDVTFTYRRGSLFTAGFCGTAVHVLLKTES